MWWLYLLITAFLLFKLYYNRVYSYWSERGVPTSPYKYVFGHMLDSLLLRKGILQVPNDIYSEFPGYNYVGYYEYQTHGLIVRNPEIVKEVLNTSFKHFHDNNGLGDVIDDPLFKKNPFFLKGAEWKEVRAQMTPLFTTNKLKAMIPLMVENGNKLVKYLEAHPDATTTGLEAKELASKITAENVASCAYGLEGACFTDENSAFRVHGKALINPGIKFAIKNVIIQTLPFMSKVLNLRFTSDEVYQFFRDIVIDTIEHRKMNPHLRRNDFIDQMTDLMAKINDQSKFNIDDIVIHAGGFFVDGYETSATEINFAFYEIAKKQSIQEKLRQEIEEVLGQNKGEITHEALQKMKYLDCVWKETLRLYPALITLQKDCTEDFQLPPLKEDNKGVSLMVKRGTKIAIPALAIQRDERFFPDPMSFNPERFSEENESSINNYTFLSFGEGPRMCLGHRFGTLQSKIAIITAVRNFKLTVNPKTAQPFQMDPLHFLLAVKGGLWLNFERL